MFTGMNHGLCSDNEGSIKCPKCGEIKERTEYHRDNASRTGLVGSCKPCRITVTNIWVVKNPEKELVRVERERVKRKKARTSARGDAVAEVDCVG